MKRMKRKKNSETVRVDAALCRRLARAAEWCDQGTSDAIAHYCPVTISTDPVENLELAEKISTEGLTRHYWLLKGAAYLTGRGPRFWNAANTTHAAEYHCTAH